MRVIRILFSIYAFTIFLLLMFLLFPAVVIASFFGKLNGGNVIYKVCTFWADAACFLWGIRHRNIYEQPHDVSQPVVFLFNHVSYMDIPILLKAFRHQHIRVLGKASLSKVPVFGYIYRNAAILVDRSSPEARARSVHQLKYFLNQNISVVIAPEGTFNMSNEPLKEFYDGAFRISNEMKVPLKPVIFPDTLDRLHHRSVFSLTPGKSRAIFLETIYPQNNTTVECLKSVAYTKMEEALIRYKASWIKTESRA